MGGEGGGVLADWIVDLGEPTASSRRPPRCPASPSAPARRSTTSSSTRRPQAEADGAAPVLALMPLPGDVDVVLASELMECGRAVQRGLVTPRPHDADRLDAPRLLDRREDARWATAASTAPRCSRTPSAAAKRFVRFDMAQAAEQSGSVISAVLFGALAGTGVLPFSRAQFEATIARGGVGVAPSLKAFARARAGRRRGRAAATRCDAGAAAAALDGADAPASRARRRRPRADRPARARAARAHRRDFPVAARDAAARRRAPPDRLPGPRLRRPLPRPHGRRSPRCRATAPAACCARPRATSRSGCRTRTRCASPR